MMRLRRFWRADFWRRRTVPGIAGSKENIMTDAILEVDNVSKRFDATQALSGVSLSLAKGSVHAVVGENGAGKSTLMNIISGIHRPDSGSIRIGGKEATLGSPLAAQLQGVGFVHQEIALCPHISALENVFMASINQQKEPLVKWKEYEKRFKQLLGDFDFNIDPYIPVGRLTISQQQILEIAKALSLNCKVLILDEPTAALTEKETVSLFKIIRELKAKGLGILYISHRMAEIFSLCDTVTVLRDGHPMGTLPLSDTNEVDLVNRMVGRDIKDIYPPKCPSPGEIIFEGKDLSDGGRFRNISFSLRRGEILGLFGLIGAGRSELAQSICGLRKLTGGEIFLEGKKLPVTNYHNSIANHVVYMTEDRKNEGLFLDMTLANNVTALDLKKISTRGIIRNSRSIRMTVDAIDRLKIKASGTDAAAGSLSGGNQQKILIAKILSVNPKVIFMDEPTRGIDVGAKYEIHRLLRQLVNEGIGICMISSELPEVIGMCDRVMVLHEGNYCGMVEGEELSEERLIQVASLGSV